MFQNHVRKRDLTAVEAFDDGEHMTATHTQTHNRTRNMTVLYFNDNLLVEMLVIYYYVRYVYVNIYHNILYYYTFNLVYP